MTSNPQKAILFVAGFLTLASAGMAFALSFNALTSLAAENGVSIPFLFPLLVEFGVVVFSVSLLYRSLSNQAIWWQWGLIIGYSVMAGGFNFAHADNTPLAQLIAVIPSLTLLLSFETFLGLIKHKVKLSTVLLSIEKLKTEYSQKLTELKTIYSDKTKELETEYSDKKKELETTYSDKKKELETITSDISAYKKKLAKLQKQATDKATTGRKKKAIELHKKGKDKDAIANMLNVTVRTVDRYLSGQNGTSGVMQ